MATEEKQRVLNPRVSEVLAKQKRWGDELAALREFCLDSGLAEELKWGQPCYVLDGKNVAVIHGFKEYCGLMFFKGALLKDPDGVLIQQTSNVQAARQMRFTSLAEVKKLKAVIKRTLMEAIAVEASGAKVAMKTVTDFEVPEEFSKRLAGDAALAQAFEALTPGRRKAYLLHFAGAKQAVTRESRIDKHAPRILQGLGLDD